MIIIYKVTFWRMIRCVFGFHYWIDDFTTHIRYCAFCSKTINNNNINQKEIDKFKRIKNLTVDKFINKTK